MAATVDFEAFSAELEKTGGASVQGRKIAIDLPCGDGNGGTLLHVAARDGLMPTVGLLLTRSPRMLDFKDRSEKTACDYALERVKRLEEQLGVRFPDNPPLTCSSDDQEAWGQAKWVLHRIRTEQTKQAACEAPFGAGVADSSGRTGLHWAAHDGDLDTVRGWVEARGDLDARDDSRNTPVDLAVDNGHVEVIRELLRAQPTRYNDRQTALSLIARVVQTENPDAIAAFLEERPNVDLARMALTSAQKWAAASLSGDEGKAPRAVLERVRKIFKDLEAAELEAPIGAPGP